MTAFSDPFGTHVLFEPLPTLLSSDALDDHGSFAHIDDDAFALDDKLDLAYKSANDLSLSELHDLRLPIWRDFDRLIDPGRVVDRDLDASNSIPDGSWALSRASVDHVCEARLHSWHIPRLPRPSQPSHGPKPAREDRYVADAELAAVSKPLLQLKALAEQVRGHNRPSDPARIALASCLVDLSQAVELIVTHEHPDDARLAMIERLLSDLVKILTQCAAAHRGEDLVVQLVGTLKARRVSIACGTISRSVLQRIIMPMEQAVLGHVGLIAMPEQDDRALPTELQTLALAATQQCPLDHAAYIKSQTMTDQELALVASTHHYIRHLDRHNPRHPLVEPRKYGIVPFDIADLASLDDAQLALAAEHYELVMGDVITAYHVDPDVARTAYRPSPLSMSASADDDTTASSQMVWSDLSNRLDRAPHTDATQPVAMMREALKASLNGSLGRESNPSPLARSIHLLQTHARLVHTSIVRTLFDTCHLERHFAFLRAKYLLGDGLFLQRLCSVLFHDTTFSPGQVPNPGAGSLVFDARNTQLWLPTDSHMRIALEDTLSDMPVVSGQPHHSQVEGQNRRYGIDQRLASRDNPVAAGFSTHTLAQPELAALVDSGLVHALELISLKYTVPSDLVAEVISNDTLAAYDDTFRYLLRAQRVLHLTVQTKANLVTTRKRASRGFEDVGAHNGSDGVPTQQEEHAAMARRFVNDGYHFATALCGYFDSSIADIWRRFQTRLARLRADLLTASAGRITGVAEIRDLHRRALGRIRARLFMDDANETAETDEGQSALDAPSHRVRACLTRCFSLIVRGCAIIETSRVDVMSPQRGDGDDHANLRDAHAYLKQSITALISMLSASEGPSRHGLDGTDHTRGESNTYDDDDIDYDDDRNDNEENDDDEEYEQHEGGDGLDERERDRAREEIRRLRDPCYRLAKLLDADGFYS